MGLFDRRPKEQKVYESANARVWNSLKPKDLQSALDAASNWPHSWETYWLAYLMSDQGLVMPFNPNAAESYLQMAMRAAGGNQNAVEYLQRFIYWYQRPALCLGRWFHYNIEPETARLRRLFGAVCAAHLPDDNRLIPAHCYMDLISKVEVGKANSLFGAGTATKAQRELALVQTMATYYYNLFCCLENGGTQDYINKSELPIYHCQEFFNDEIMKLYKLPKDVHMCAGDVCTYELSDLSGLRYVLMLNGWYSVGWNYNKLLEQFAIVTDKFANTTMVYFFLMHFEACENERPVLGNYITGKIFEILTRIPGDTSTVNEYGTMLDKLGYRVW